MVIVMPGESCLLAGTVVVDDRPQQKDPTRCLGEVYLTSF